MARGDPTIGNHSHVCTTCGDPFKSYKAVAKYCSAECMGVAYRQAPPRRKPLHALTCRQCGREFGSRKASATFCSRECTWTHRRSDSYKPRSPRGVALKERRVVNCETCGKQFRALRPTHRFCSRWCMHNLTSILTPDDFWRCVDSSGGPDSCWPWLRKSNNGDGQAYAHRVAYELTHGVKLSSREFVCHHCDYPPCANPKHLFLGDYAINMADCIAKGRARYTASLGSANGSAKLTEAGISMGKSWKHV